MTELEGQLLDQLITAAWPLRLQVAFAVVLVAGYFLWSRLYYRSVDRRLRSAVGRRLGARIIWVPRHSGSYQTPFETGFARYHRWTWGIEAEHDRTFLRDGLVALLTLVIVNVLGGLWPIAIFLWVFLGLEALAYVVFLPLCVALIAIYSIFWSGRYQVSGMRTSAY